MLHTLRIITDHIATIQLAAIKSHVAGVHMNQRSRKKNKTYVEFGLTYHTPTVNISDFVGKSLNSDIDQLDLTNLDNLFQIKDPQKCTELVS